MFKKPIFQIHHRIHRHHRGELSDSGAGDVLDGVQLFHRYQKDADGQQRALHLRDHRHLPGVRQHRLLRHGRKNTPPVSATRWRNTPPPPIRSSSLWSRTERCWSSARTHTMRSWAASCSPQTVISDVTNNANLYELSNLENTFSEKRRNLSRSSAGTAATWKG